MTTIIHKWIPVLACLLGLVIWQGEARASVEAQVFQWQAEETTRRGRRVGCEVLVDGMIRLSLYVTANLALLAETVEPNRVSVGTLLKITVAERKWG